MVVDELSPASLRPWLIHNYRELARAVAPIVCLGIAWWISAENLPPAVWASVVVYCLAHLLLIALVYRRASRRPGIVDTLIGVQRLLLDSLLAGVIVWFAPELSTAFYPLYILIGLRVLSSYQQAPTATIIPFLLGPAYILNNHLAGDRSPVSELNATADWTILLSSLAFGAVAIWSSATRQRENDLLREELRNERLAREARVGELERTTNDIRSRMRDLHALEEGLRVITSTLSLNDVLSQIVDSTMQMLGSKRIHSMALSLSNGNSFDHRLYMVKGEADGRWATSIARRAIQQEAPLIIDDAALDAELAALLPQGLRAALCVPLFIGDGPARGALTIMSHSTAAFSSSDARHLTAFALQAGIAISNAEMHSQLQRQQRLLRSVVRDINDGLVVIDVTDAIVLTNPLGEELLNRSTETMPIRDELLALATNMRAKNTPMLTYELRLAGEDEDGETIYQAFASQVRLNDDQQPLTAIVLHDITAQKAEERSRTEFISMVSHELRNPLNSLNGFIKVVLQGRAGALTPLQHEFLEIADGQVEQLKGRISELLEFNRIDAGRLSLDPTWSDLPILASATITRLRLQAEQAGITLLNQVDDALPECYFDVERIGQVMTNLIENAIKATPPGGTITVHSALQESEVWIRISDTGVGIPPEEVGKVFQRFYRVHNRTSSQGNHLGLGLAICQQIIEGHKGRIWVESVEGKGSCFTFALPVVEQAIAANS